MISIVTKPYSTEGKTKPQRSSMKIMGKKNDKMTRTKKNTVDLLIEYNYLKNHVKSCSATTYFFSSYSLCKAEKSTNFTTYAMPWKRFYPSLLEAMSTFISSAV